MLGVVEDFLIHVAGVSVQGRQLTRHRLYHAWMAVPDRGHVVVAIQVLLAIRAIHIGTLGTNELHRMLVHQLVARPQQALTALDHCLLVSAQGRQQCQVEAVLHAGSGGIFLRHLNLQKIDY
ncbi:hypothetical protein D3C75_805060 [compost metagenome]